MSAFFAIPAPKNEEELLAHLDCFLDEETECLMSDDAYYWTLYKPSKTPFGRVSLTVNHFAAMYGSTAALEQIPIINTLVKLNDTIISPLYMAVECGHFDYIKELVAIYDNEYDEGAAGWFVDIVNEYDEQALNLAIRRGRVDIAKYLIDNGFPCPHGKEVDTVELAREHCPEVFDHIMNKVSLIHGRDPGKKFKMPRIKTGGVMTVGEAKEFVKEATVNGFY